MTIIKIFALSWIVLCGIQPALAQSDPELIVLKEAGPFPTLASYFHTLEGQWKGNFQVLENVHGKSELTQSGTLEMSIHQESPRVWLQVETLCTPEALENPCHEVSRKYFVQTFGPNPLPLPDGKWEMGTVLETSPLSLGSLWRQTDLQSNSDSNLITRMRVEQLNEALDSYTRVELTRTLEQVHSTENIVLHRVKASSSPTSEGENQPELKAQ